MAAALDKHVMSDPNVRKHVDLSLDFVGFFKDWSTTNVSECQTSSGWSECSVNAYHLCGQALAASQHEWWQYSACMYAAQTPWEECATKYAWPNATCTPANFSAALGRVSDTCAVHAGLHPARLRECLADGRGARLLQASNKKTVSFPKGPAGVMIEPQWVEVDGPDCGETGWNRCKSAFDKTHCLNWGACDPDAWGQHIRTVVCDKAAC